MATNDVFVLKQKQTYFGQAMLNVFYYRLTLDFIDPLTPSEELFDAFDLAVLSTWTTIVSTSVIINEVETININTPVDTFSGTPTNSVGGRALTDNLRAPSWVSASFKSNRAGAGSRRSYKRFSGIGEVDINDNEISPGFVTLGAGIKASMGDVLVGAAGRQFTPVQVKSGWLLGIAPTVNFNLVEWQDPTLTSQVSRKP